MIDEFSIYDYVLGAEDYELFLPHPFGEKTNTVNIIN